MIVYFSKNYCIYINKRKSSFVRLIVPLFVHSLFVRLVRSFVHSFVCSFVRSFVRILPFYHFSPVILTKQLCRSVRPHVIMQYNIYINKRKSSFVRSFVRSFVHLFVRSFVRPFVRSFFRSFVRSFIHSFIHSFVRSFVHSFIHSFICMSPFYHI